MKNINFTLLGQYKFIQTNIILLFILISSYSITLNAQDGGSAPVATMQYSVNKTVTYGIPINSDIKLLDDYDISYIRPFSKIHTVTNELYSNGNICMTYNYPNGMDNPDPWINQIFKTITDNYGVKYFDNNNLLTFQRSFEHPSSLEPATQNKIDNFGYVHPITTPSQNSVFNLLNNGFQFQIKNDGSYSISNDSTTLIFDPQNQTSKMLFMDNGNIIYEVYQKFLQLTNGKYVVSYKETKKYLPTVNGQLQIEEKTIENFYNFIKNNTSLNSLSTRQVSNNNLSSNDKDIYTYAKIDNQIDAIIVNPNPSNGIINLRLSTKKLNESNLVLLDMDGKVIKKLNSIQPNLDYPIDLSDVSNGVYILKSENPTSILYQKIIKQ